MVSTGPRRLAAGEIAVLELAVCVDGFWADVTRVAWPARPRPLQKRAFAAVRDAQDTALAAIAPGVKAGVPHTGHPGPDRGRLRPADGPPYRPWRRLPLPRTGTHAHARQRRQAEVGHVCTVEPGLYDPAWGGIRLEDNIVVTADGLENLTKTAKIL